MTEQTGSTPDALPAQPSEADGEQQYLIVGPDGQPLAAVPASALATLSGATGEDDSETEKSVAEQVHQPAKVMRIGTMVKQLLEEVKAAPLDEASRSRLAEIHASSVRELEEGLAPELVEELQRLSLPFADDAIPSEGELRIAQAQLVGWLEGLFHGIQAAMYASQMNAQAQMQQLQRALPAGMVANGQGQPGGAQPAGEAEESPGVGGMYL